MKSENKKTSNIFITLAIRLLNRVQNRGGNMADVCFQKGVQAWYRKSTHIKSDGGNYISSP